MKLRIKAAGTFGAAAALAAAGVAAGSTASADTNELTQHCTMVYSGTNAPAAQAFDANVNWAYNEHGNVTGTPPYVLVPDHETEIDLPANVVETMAATGVGHNASVSGAEYYTVNGVNNVAPMTASAVPINNIDGVMTLTVGTVKDQSTKAYIPAGVDTSQPVALAHAATSVTWTSDKGITGTLTCGRIPASSPTGTPTTPTGGPTGTAPTGGPTGTPTAPTTGAPTGKPTGGVTPPSGSSSAPTAPAPGAGPKVQTDQVSNGSSNNGLAVAVGGGLVLAAAGGSTLAVRRRKN